MPPSNADRPIVRAFFKDDGILLEFPTTKLIEGAAKITLMRQDISPKALEEATSAPEARHAVGAVLLRPSCVQRTDIEPFAIHTLLPKGKTREKERIWRGLLGLLESLGYEAHVHDLRTPRLKKVS